MFTKRIKTLRNGLLFVMLAILAGVFATACGASEPEPLSLTINMTEYAFAPNIIEFQVGQEVTLQLTNSGVLEHEFMIGRDVVFKEGKPTNYEVDFFEHTGVEPMVMMTETMKSNEHGAEATGNEHGSDIGFMIRLPQGDQEATVTFVVTEDMVGEWEIGCFLLESVHYTSGMKGKLIVKS